METRFYLGNVPVIPQETATIEVEPVIEALKNNNIVVLKIMVLLQWEKHL